MVVAAHTSTILRRTGSRPRQANRKPHCLIVRDQLFHLDLMLPTVAEIVFIRKSLPLPLNHLTQNHRIFVANGRTAILHSLTARVLDWVEAAAKSKAMHVVPIPSHRGINRVVQVAEREIVGHQDPPPDRRLDVAKADLELKNVLRRRRNPNESRLFPFRPDWHVDKLTAHHTDDTDFLRIRRIAAGRSARTAATRRMPS